MNKFNAFHIKLDHEIQLPKLELTNRVDSVNYSKVYKIFEKIPSIGLKQHKVIKKIKNKIKQNYVLKEN